MSVNRVIRSRTDGGFPRPESGLHVVMYLTLFSNACTDTAYLTSSRYSFSQHVESAAVGIYIRDNQTERSVAFTEMMKCGGYL